MGALPASPHDQQPPVVLLRSPSEPDPYDAVFAAAGYAVRSEPVLSFTFIHQERLKTVLAQPEAYSGLILTSPRAAMAIQHLAAGGGQELAAWKERPIYTVGPRTAADVRTLGGTPRGAETGSGEDLADFIVDAVRETSTVDRPLLLLSGNRRREDLPNRLVEAGLALDELVVYETHLRTDLTLPPGPSGAWLVFFSPTGVQAVRHSGADVTAWRVAAIGPTTAEAVRQAGWRVAAVAASPTPQALLDAVKAAS